MTQVTAGIACGHTNVSELPQNRDNVFVRAQVSDKPFLLHIATLIYFDLETNSTIN